MQNFPEDFYVFLTKKDGSSDKSYIKIIGETEYQGMVFEVNDVFFKKKLFGGYKFKYNYNIIEPPNDKNVNLKSKKLDRLIGDIILDIIERY